MTLNSVSKYFTQPLVKKQADSAEVFSSKKENTLLKIPHEKQIDKPSESISNKSVLVYRIGPGNQNISVRYEIESPSLSQVI